MGIRINKGLAYGVTDIQVSPEGYDIEDPRIDYEALRDRWERAYNVGVAAFMADIEKERGLVEELFRFENRAMQHDMFDTSWNMAKNFLQRKEEWRGPNLHWDGEYGVKNLLYLHPISFEEAWHRRDDTIDYYFATHVRTHDGEPVGWEGPRDYVTVLEEGIFPFSGFRIRHRNAAEGVGENLREKLRMESSMHNMLRGTFSKDAPPLASGADLEDLNTCWRPPLPLELIWTLVWFKDAFTDLVAFANELRPLHYEYWS